MTALLDGLVFGLYYLASALVAIALVCGLIAVAAVAYHAPGMHRRRRLRRSPYWTALRHSIRRTA